MRHALRAVALDLPGDLDHLLVVVRLLVADPVGGQADPVAGELHVSQRRGTRRGHPCRTRAVCAGRRGGRGRRRGRRRCSGRRARSGARRVQSIHAPTPSMIGQPVDECVHVTSSKRPSPTPLLAKRQHSAAWSSRRTLTQNLPAGAIACHVSLLTIGRKPTSGGSSDTDVNDPIVNPAGDVAGHAGHDRDAGREVAEHLAELGGVERRERGARRSTRRLHSSSGHGRHPRDTS